MNKGKWFTNIVLFALVAFVTQYLFVSFVPNIIFAIAKHRSANPLNTVIHAPKTDANLRRVVLPNPDFVYSACFYDASQNDVLITAEFPDSTQYASLAFYANNIQPYYIANNQVGMKSKVKMRLSTVGRIRSEVRSPSEQGAILMRILAVDSAQMLKALALQKTFKVSLIDKNE